MPMTDYATNLGGLTGYVAKQKKVKMDEAVDNIDTLICDLANAFAEILILTPTTDPRSEQLITWATDVTNIHTAFGDLYEKEIAEYEGENTESHILSFNLNGMADALKQAFN